MKRNLYILLTLFAVLLAGCEHKDFCCRCLQADDVEVCSTGAVRPMRTRRP